MHGPDVAVSNEKREALTELLAGYGPYRRDLLRQKLLSKAALLRDEADAVQRAQAQFARLGRTGTNPRRQLLAEAAELGALADLVTAEVLSRRSSRAVSGEDARHA